MNRYKTILAASMVSMLVSPFYAYADNGNWKKGRIYYRMVCTACHKDNPSGAIPPASKTIAEWKTYIKADSHAKGKDKFSYYISKKYRESIKATNRAAAIFINVPDEKLMADVKAFVIYGAKDSDNPAKCN